MIQMLRKRLSRKDEGFTLIELMVVVLIIAILLAIAIPTYLGARSRAQNRAAESNLNTALTASKTGFTDNQSYYSLPATLASIEPSISWVAATPVKGSNQVGVNVVDTGNAVCLWAESSSGNYYGEFDVEAVDAAYPAGDQGTIYYSGTAAPGCDTGSTFTYPTLVSSGGGWSNTTGGASW